MAANSVGVGYPVFSTVNYWGWDLEALVWALTALDTCSQWILTGLK